LPAPEIQLAADMEQPGVENLGGAIPERPVRLERRHDSTVEQLLRGIDREAAVVQRASRVEPPDGPSSGVGILAHYRYELNAARVSRWAD
jgi:hypothetical protein